MKLPDRFRVLLRSNAIPSVLFGAMLVAALVYLDELRAWFALSPPVPALPASTAARSSPPTTSTYAFPDAARSALEGALADYDKARALLAADSIEGLTDRGRAIAEWIRRASAVLDNPPQAISRSLLDAGTAAEKLAAATSLDQARTAFSELSRALVSLAASDPRLQQGKHIFECPMAEGFNKWVQPSDKLENPYMGQSMLGCGSASAWAAPSGDGMISHEGHDHEGTDVAFYTCSMHPSVKRSEPGACPICSMDLTPVTYDEEEGGVIFVDPVRRQQIGVRLGEVSKTVLVKRIRTVGKLTYDETKLHDISLKYKGWIQHLHADKLGMRVKRGAPLFSVYSPEIYAAQGDLITALSGPSLLAEEDAGNKSDPLVGIARERLRLLGAHGLERSVKKTGKPVRYITVTSPATGYIVEKNVVDGSAFTAGARVMRIAGLDTVWIDAELYESELPLVKEGQQAVVGLSYLPGKQYEGKLTYIYPYLDPKTRTGKARIELDNRKLELKPDMYANVTIEVELGERLSVPESAVIYTGRRRLVFVDLGAGRLRPSIVTLGVQAGGRYEVLRGLKAGDKVVTSGNFLVAAESRIRSAARYWGGDDDAAPPVGALSSAPAAVTPKPVSLPKRAGPKGGKPKPAETIYQCPMHPEIMGPSPGKCSKCGMALKRKKP